jgi:peptidoglycan/LPS O-acetylase OafA/YrhL
MAAQRAQVAEAVPAPAHAAPRVFGLDLIRAVAVTLVLIAHASYLLEPVFAAPRTFQVLAVLGVELFFVLSGFLIGGIIIDTVRPEARWVVNFWLRRWMRTLPNYFLFLALNVFLFRMAYRRWPAFGSFVVFAQGLAWPHPQFFNEAWSLAVEEVFYLLAPLVAVALLPLARSRTRVLGMLMAAVVVLGAVRVAYVVGQAPPWDMGVRKVSLVRLDCIVYGVIAAYVCRRWQVSLALRRGLAVGGLALAAAASAWVANDLVLRSPVIGALFFSVVPAGFAALLPLAETVTDRGVPDGLATTTRSLALWSYSLYLTNLPVLRLIDAAKVSATTPMAAVLLFSWDVVVAVAWAAANYRAVELPIMNARDRAAASLGLVRAAAPVPAAGRRARR